jgi:hypothetical protein
MMGYTHALKNFSNATDRLLFLKPGMPESEI